jgi:hypothetical protein
MTTATRHLFLLCVLAFLLVGLVAAQSNNSSQSAVVPRLVNFSGKAIDGEKIITGVAGATFAIYSDQSGGSPLWLETQNIQADALGHYTAQLGATKPEGLPLDLFTSGEARWLGVTINGGQEQPRVLLLSVPYALKAADADTVGGLPPSAFMLAAPATAAAVSNDTSANSTTNGVTPAVTGTGTTDFIPLWTNSTGALGSSVLFQSGTGSTSKIGINSTTPASTLDVNGAATVRGTLALPATGPATTAGGKNSQPATLTASAYNSSTKAAVTQNFRWQAEPAGNNTATPSGTLNLLYSSGTAAPAETGLKITPKGLLTFASGQTFPGTGEGTITGVTAGTALTGGGTSGTVTLNLNTTQVPLLVANNNFTGNNLFTPSAAADAIDAYTAGPGKTALVGIENATSGGSYGVWARTSDPSGAGVFGLNVGGTGGIGVSGTGDTGIYGTSSTGNAMVANGNVSQSRPGGGWVKAMAVIQGIQAPYTILYCFNSTLSGAAATTPPCGFTLSEVQAGEFIIDFGFDVSDRFFSTTQECCFSYGVAPLFLGRGGTGSTSVYLFTWDGSNTQPYQASLLVY